MLVVQCILAGYYSERSELLASILKFTVERQWTTYFHRNRGYNGGDLALLCDSDPIFQTKLPAIVLNSIPLAVYIVNTHRSI